MIETLDDIIEHIADLCGVYGGHREAECQPPDNCCRVCWTSHLKARINQAVRDRAKVVSMTPDPLAHELWQAVQYAMKSGFPVDAEKSCQQIFTESATRILARARAEEVESARRWRDDIVGFGGMQYKQSLDERIAELRKVADGK